MGSIITAHCECGYKKEEMFVGGGMRDFGTVCNFPHYCEACKIVFEANLLKKERYCPECGTEKVVAYEDHACRSEEKIVFSWNAIDLDGELKLTDGWYFCPACGSYRLIFSDVGSWD